MTKAILRPEKGIQIGLTKKYLFDPDAVVQYAEETVDNAVQESLTAIQNYIETEAKPEIQAIANNASASASAAAESASNADADADNAAESAGLAAELATQAYNSSQSAKTSETNAANSAEEAKQYAISVSFGNIGDIQYTCRTDVPNGGAWCDGAEYTQAAFPDIYQMLVDGKLQKTDYETFNSSVSTNGCCGIFALDESNQKFKVPLLKDVYIKAGQTPSMFGAESLPNITGVLDCVFISARALGHHGVFSDTSFSTTETGLTSKPNWNISSGGGEKYTKIDFKAVNSSSTYQDGAKVNPDHVVYRAYVVLYASAAEASVAQAQEFMTALGGKANVGLDNVSPAQSFKDMSVIWGLPDYSAGVTLNSTELANGYTPPCAGVVICYNVASSKMTQWYVNDVFIFRSIANNSNNFPIQVSLGSQDVLKVTGTLTDLSNIMFYPYKGVSGNA